MSMLMRKPGAAQAIVPSGMQQTSNVELASNTWWKLPEVRWADTWATYPFTTQNVTGDGIIVQGSGLARITVTANTNSSVGSRDGRYLINGTPNKTTATMTSNEPHVQVFDNVQLNNGDEVIAEFINNGSITSQRTFTGCKLEIIPMP